MRPTLAKTFSMWPYVENVCPPLAYIINTRILLLLLYSK